MIQWRHVTASVLTLFVLCGWATALGAQQAAPAARPPTTAALPSGREVIDRSITAMGGAEILARRKSKYSKGTFEMIAQGLKGTMDLYSARPSRQLVRIDLPGVGLVETAFDGVVGWSIDPSLGPRLMKDTELDRAKLLAEFDSELHRAEQYETLETLERTTFEGKDCYKVRVKSKSGLEWTEFYDTRTGLFAGMIGDQSSPMGSVTVTSVVDEYKAFEGILLPVVRVQRMTGGFEIRMTIVAVEFDKVDDKVFEMPAAIKTLAGR